MLIIDRQSIADLEGIVDSLPDEEKELFHRLYAINTTIGELKTSRQMEPWVEENFGSLEAVKRQKIVKLTNHFTREEVLFNELRASRPHQSPNMGGIAARLEGAREKDIFTSPQDSTPEDTFGRVTGKYCVTASKIAKNDGLHGLIIFDEFDPLAFSRERVIDYIDTALEWAKRARRKPCGPHSAQAEACMPRSSPSTIIGASH